MFCVVDTETTGLKPDYHEIIQVAVILCDDNLDEVARTSFRIRPKWIERADAKALEINGYQPRTWNPKFFSHKKAFLHLNKFFSAHNKYNEEIVTVGQNVKFDMGFLSASYERESVLFPFSYKTLDLMNVAKVWSAEKGIRIRKFTLGNLTEITGQVNRNPHDAEADAEVTLNILKWFVKDLKKGGMKCQKIFR